VLDVRNENHVGAELLALDRYHRQRGDEKAAIALARIAVDQRYGHACADVESAGLPVKWPILVADEGALMRFAVLDRADDGGVVGREHRLGAKPVIEFS